MADIISKIIHIAFRNPIQFEIYHLTIICRYLILIIKPNNDTNIHDPRFSLPIRESR